MVVAVKLGLLEHRGKVRTPQGTIEILQGDDGWYGAPGPRTTFGRVRYDDDHEVLEIEHEGQHLMIHFRPETERTTFECKGRIYDVASMDFGEISIREGSQVAVRGHTTLSGVRLKSVDANLQPLEGELAFGLALRSVDLEDDFWNEDHPLIWGLEERLEDARLRYDEKEGKGTGDRRAT